jgi:hypothetical protein
LPISSCQLSRLTIKSERPTCYGGCTSRRIAHTKYFSDNISSLKHTTNVFFKSGESQPRFRLIASHIWLMVISQFGELIKLCKNRRMFIILFSYSKHHPFSVVEIFSLFFYRWTVKANCRRYRSIGTDSHLIRCNFKMLDFLALIHQIANKNCFILVNPRLAKGESNIPLRMWIFLDVFFRLSQFGKPASLLQHYS